MNDPSSPRRHIARACFDAALAVLLLVPVVVAVNGWR